jgi:hypothetical protein
MAAVMDSPAHPDAALPRRSPAKAMAMARVGRHILSGNLLLGALTVVLIAPFFVFRTIPLYDLPNHIARQHILFGDGAAGATLYYGVAWRLIPNLAMEGFRDSRAIVTRRRGRQSCPLRRRRALCPGRLPLRL